MANTDVGINSTVTFLNGGKSVVVTGTVSALNDDFHVTIALTGGGTLTNVPHITQNPYLGWYATPTPATETTVTGVITAGTIKHRVKT